MLLLFLGAAVTDKNLESHDKQTWMDLFYFTRAIGCFIYK